QFQKIQAQRKGITAMEGKVISTSFVESAVVNAPVSAIWPFIKLKEFGKFYSAIQKVETIPGERETVKWYFENDTILTLQEEEYSTVKKIHVI
ncbi:hypothetical protein, partial [Salmonella sp. s29923]|uniref:hypothetical protein n=1 Tax=Salmonella sp. s29923 TaxID=3159635 RepID=UPI00397F8819